jgi:hypothetical protein
MTMSVGGLERHLFHGEGIPQDVLGQVFEVSFGFRGDDLAGVDVESTVLPGVEDLDPFGREELLLD